MHGLGGGFGFGFSQYTPGPASMPGAVGQALGVYTSWANAMSVEPMPQYRDFIVDRSNISSIGNISINAVEARKTINCSKMGLDVVQDVDGDQIAFATNLTSDMQNYTWVRFQPQLAVWVHNYTNVSASRAVVQIMFAAINGTIENGYFNKPTKGMMDYWESPPNSHWYGISSLACDVDIELVDSSFCTGTQTQCSMTLPRNSTLSLAANLTIPTDYAKNAIWLGAAPSFFGGTVFGTQSMFSPGNTGGNFSRPLPVAYTTSISGLDSSDHAWDQETLINFINVSSGALGLVLTRSWGSGNITVLSELATPRLALDSTFILLAPVGIALLAIVMLLWLSALLYKDTNVPVVRLGTTAEIIRSSQTADIQEALSHHRGVSERDRAALSRFQVKYGVLPESGLDGFGRAGNVGAF
jgi:hypothetical protein